MPKRPAQVRLNEAQRQLVEDNIALVIYTLRREFGRDYAKDEDNIAEGMFALCCAAASYDAGNKATFATYAYRVIKNRMHVIARNNGMQKRKPDQSPISLDALIRDTKNAPTKLSVGDCIKSQPGDLGMHPEDIVDHIAYTALIDDIKGRYPMVVDVLLADKKGAHITALAKKEHITRQAMMQRYERQLERVRRTYGKKYGRIMYGNEITPSAAKAPGVKKGKDESNSVGIDE